MIAPRTRRIAVTTLHALILATLLGQALYCGAQVFLFLQPGDLEGPLFGAARDVDLDLFVRRRLYAIEGWIAFVGAALYLGILLTRPPR